MATADQVVGLETQSGLTVLNHVVYLVPPLMAGIVRIDVIRHDLARFDTLFL